MRPSGFVLVALAVGLVSLGLRGGSVEEFTRPPKPRGVTSSPVEVDGPPRATVEKAREGAVEKARAELTARLREQSPPVLWEPTAEFVREKLAVFLPEEVRHPGTDPGTSGLEERMYIAHVRLDVSPADRQEILKKDRAARAELRLWQAGRWLAAAVAVLAAAAAYVRLDNATRGYLTRWLQAGVLAVAAGAVAFLWRSA